MIINFIGRKPDIKEDVLIGNQGDINVTTIQFILPKSYDGLDLTSFTPYIEWEKLAGDSGVIELTIAESTSNIVIDWLLPETILATAGKGTLCITFTSTDNTVKYKISNIYIYVKDTIEVE